ncbi:MAG: DUF4397 domain-containing protein [Saprospiraceae bacterium]|nr:DUF4397 domain-containing protein [Saprospiraceae bacterium]
MAWILVGDEGTDKTAKRFDARESDQPPTLTIRYTKRQNDSRLPAKIQFIHNAADQMIANLNVSINEQMIATGLAFRSATPFVEVPSNRNLVLKLQQAGILWDSGALRSIFLFDLKRARLTFYLPTEFYRLIYLTIE